MTAKPAGPPEDCPEVDKIQNDSKSTGEVPGGTPEGHRDFFKMTAKPRNFSVLSMDF